MDGDSVDKTFLNGQQLSAIFLDGRFWITLQGIELVLLAALFLASGMRLDLEIDFLHPLKKALDQIISPQSAIRWVSSFSLPPSRFCSSSLISRSRRASASSLSDIFGGSFLTGIWVQQC